MSQAEELLNGMSEEIPVHTHPVPDTDTYFIIDPITRKIENTNPKKHVIMQYDHNSERCTFELPRFIDGHDMLECTSVTVNVDNIEVVESEGVEEAEPVEPRISSDAPDITDLRAHPNDPEKVICSWLISRNSTQLAGILSFHIEFKCVDPNGNVVYEWSTDDYDEIQIKARKKNGEAAVVPHSDLLEQWRTRIFGAGDSVMANIMAEGESQVAAVKAESETQQEAVELKGVQTLNTIPEDYTEVDAMADEAVRSKGDAIGCEAAGESIVLKDSSNDHIRGLKLFGKSTQITTTGKNKLNLGQISERTVNGVALTPVYDDNGNLRYLNINGTATNTFLIHTVPFSIAAGTYKFTNFVDRTTEDGTLHAQICDSEGGILYPTDKGLGGTFTFETDSNLQYRIYIHEGRVANYEKIYPMLRDASIEDAAYEPYTGGKPSPNPEYPQEIVSVENPTVNVYGKNLLNCSDISLTDFANHYHTIYTDFSPIIGETYALSMNVNTDVLPFAINIGCGSTKYDADMSPKISASYTENGRIVISFKWAPTQEQIECGYTKLFIRVPRYASKTTFNATVTNIQLELGSEATEYEPYKPIQAISLNRVLSGIPVSSCGNYTDSDGRQWVCDEVDLERGVYVQRIKQLILDGSETWKTSGGKYIYTKIGDYASKPSNGFCSCIPYKYSYEGDGIFAVDNVIYLGEQLSRSFNLDVTPWVEILAANPAPILYTLATPIETPLTAEEIMAFKALRTNYPNTTILNDAGAWMSVKYNADTKTYVENPRVLKLVDSSTGVVYELKIVNGNLTVNPV